MMIQPAVDAKFGGSIFAFDTSTPSIQQQVVYDSSRWSEGLSSNVETLDRMIASDEAGGYWMLPVPVGNLFEGETFSGVAISAVGEGLTLEYSEDGSAWTSFQSGEVILEDEPTADLWVIIRVNLPDEEAWFESLRVQIYRNRTVLSQTGPESLTYTNVSMREYLADTDQMAAGADIKDGFIQIGPDTGNGPQTIAALAGWFRVSDTNGTLVAFSGSAYVSVSSGSYTFAGMTAYRNGVAVSNGSQPNNQWAHYLFVPNTASSTRVKIGTRLATDDFLDVAVGSLTVFPTAPDPAKLYAANGGSRVIQVVDSSFDITEPASPLDIYAYSWSVISG